MADSPKASNDHASRGLRVASVCQCGGGVTVIGVFAEPAPETRGEELAGDSIRSFTRSHVNAFQIMGSYPDRATRSSKTWVRFFFTDVDGQQVGEDAFIRVFDAASYAQFTAARSASCAIAFAEERREPRRADWREWSELGAS
jgi:hypothetical protein